MERVNDIGGQTFVKEKSEDVVAVMPGGFKSYFYFTQIRRYRLERLEKQVEAVQVILDREHILEHFSVRVYDAAVVLVFGNVNANVDHGVSLLVVIDAAGVHRTACPS